MAIKSNPVTEAQYARYRGVHRSTVLSWKRKGLLVRDGELIHTEASDAILDGRPSSYRGGRMSAKSNGSTAPSEEHAVDNHDALDWSLAEATRRKEIAIALTRQLQLSRAKGELVRVVDVKPAWARIVLAVRSAMLAIPGKLRLLLPHLSPADIEVIGKAIKDGLIAAALAESPPGIADDK